MWPFTKQLLQTVSAIFLPHYCLLCGLMPTTDGLCFACEEALPWQQTVCPQCAQPMPENILCGDCLRYKHCYDQIIAPLRYEQTVRYLITQFKFHEQLICADLLSVLLIKHLSAHPDFVQPDLLLPVPLHRVRMKHRGFNQALELSKSLAAALSIPLDRKILYKKEDSAPQSSLDFKTRKKNIKNRFGLSGKVAGLHVAIIDDVVTTGSTVNEIAALLKQNGALRVSVYAVARTVRRQS
jgi:ComF family protein